MTNFSPHTASDLTQTVCCICSEKKSSLLFTVDGLRIVRCIQCGLIYVNPRFTSEKLKDVYDHEYFDGIGKRYFENEWRLSYFKPIIDQLIKITGLKRGKILDIGTAGGHFMKHLKNRGFMTYGIEPSTAASSFARKQLGLHVKTGNLLSAHFPENSFDIVTLNDVIEHMPNPRKNLEHAHSLLKEGGWLVLSTPNIDSLGFRIFCEGFVFIVPQVHLWYFSPETLSILLHNTGFVIRKITYPYFDTPFFNIKELLRLFLNIVRKKILSPNSFIPSAPWYGNVIKIYAQKI